MVMSGDVLFPGLRNFAFCFSLWCLQWYEKGQWRGHQITFSAIFFCQLIANVPFSETQFIFMFWIAMSTKIWSLIIVSVKTPPTGIYRAKQSSVFKRLLCLPGSWHMIECVIFVITGQFCAGWCTYYFTSSRSQKRIMTCYEWPRNHCAVANQLAAAWMWLAGAIPLSTVHSNSLLYFLLFYENPDLVWELISVSENIMINCIVKIIENVFEKMKFGYFL